MDLCNVRNVCMNLEAHQVHHQWSIMVNICDRRFFPRSEHMLPRSGREPDLWRIQEKTAFFTLELTLFYHVGAIPAQKKKTSKYRHKLNY